MTAFEGIRRAQLNCTAEGFPLPRIVWYRNTDIVLQKENTASLPLVLAVTPDDTGVYQCIATSALGEAESISSTLVIRELLQTHTHTHSLTHSLEH
jgi:hypothetical protein